MNLISIISFLSAFIFNLLFIPLSGLPVRGTQIGINEAKSLDNDNFYSIILKFMKPFKPCDLHGPSASSKEKPPVVCNLRSFKGLNLPRLIGWLIGSGIKIFFTYIIFAMAPIIFLLLWKRRLRKERT